MHQRLDSPDDLLHSEEKLETPSPGQGRVARLPGTAAQLIGERMRAMYATLVREPVPDQLLDLIRELEDKEPTS